SGRTVNLTLHGSGKKATGVRSPVPTPATAIRRPLFELSNGGSRTAATTVPSSSQSGAKSSFSFADVASSNSDRRVMEDGKLIAVRDSDEESNASLESLGDLFSKNKTESGSSRKQKSSDLANSQQEAERVQLLSMFSGGRSVPLVQQDEVRQLMRKQHDAKFDLSSILNEHLDDEESEMKTKRTYDDIELMNKEMEDAKQIEMDKKLLAAILQGDNTEEADSTNIDRLMKAVERTEALHGEKIFSFFDRAYGEKPAPKLEPFPDDEIPQNLWQPNDTHARDRAFESGIISSLARNGQVSDNVLRWTFYASMYEPDPLLQEAYLKTISAASSLWVRSNITPLYIHRMFEALGAQEVVLHGGAIKARHYSKQRAINSSNVPKRLLPILRLLSTICVDVDFECLSKLTPIALRLVLDAGIMSSYRAHKAVHDLLEHLLTLPDIQSRAHVYDKVVSDFSSNLLDPVLQAQFLQHFVSTAMEAAKLRTKLAKTFLLTGMKEVELDVQDSTSLCSHVVSSPDFAIIRKNEAASVDYIELAARVSILDVALGDSYCDKKSLNITVEKDFNKVIDKLADHLHALNASIVDTGASHMKRTDAKNVIVGLHSRLLYSVRTKPRKKKHVFDLDRDNKKQKKVSFGESLRSIDDTGEVRKKSVFMDRFLSKNRSGDSREEGSLSNITKVAVPVH
ncbi:hypothetical protein LTR66_016232, partial [Elasticomyces elasticus]